MTPVAVQRVLHEKHALRGLAEMAGVDKQQAQTTLENVYGRTSWKDAHNKDFFFRKHLSVDRFVNTFCLQYRQVWQNWKELAPYRVRLGLFIHHVYFSRYFCAIILTFWHQCYLIMVNNVILRRGTLTLSLSLCLYVCLWCPSLSVCLCLSSRAKNALVYILRVIFA